MSLVDTKNSDISYHDASSDGKKYLTLIDEYSQNFKELFSEINSLNKYVLDYDKSATNDRILNERQKKQKKYEFMNIDGPKRSMEIITKIANFLNEHFIAEKNESISDKVKETDITSAKYFTQIVVFVTHCFELFIKCLSYYKNDIKNGNDKETNSYIVQSKNYHFKINKCLEKLKSLYPPPKKSRFGLGFGFGGKRGSKKPRKLRGKKTRKLRGKKTRKLRQR